MGSGEGYVGYPARTCVPPKGISEDRISPGSSPVICVISLRTIFGRTKLK